MIAKLKNLTDTVQMDEKGSDEIMRCNVCGREYSANLGDYFWVADPECVFKCCGEPLELVVKMTYYVGRR